MSNSVNSFHPKAMRKSGERRRATLLQVAAEVFLERGFEGASLSEILARSGGSRRMVYEQFGDKEGLFEAIMAERCSAMLVPMNDPDLLNGAPEPMLRRIAQCFMDVMTTDAVASLRRIAMGEGSKFPRVAAIFFRSGVDPAIARVAEAFALLNSQGFQFADPELAAIMFLSMVQGDAIDRLTARTNEVRPKQTLEQQIDFAVTTMLLAGRQQKQTRHDLHGPSTA